MERIRRPLDEERNQLNALETEFVHHSESLPVENSHIGSCARTVARSEDLMTRFASLLRDRVYVGRCRCPGNQSRLAELSDINLKAERRLPRIRRDDLMVLSA